MTSERRQQLLSLLCVIRREKAEKIKIEDKQNRVILAGVFLQYVLYLHCEKTQVRSDEEDNTMQVIADDWISLWDVAVDETFVTWCQTLSYGVETGGKPYLTDYPEVHFNLSHSGDWVVVAVSNEFVGIDVEKRVPTDKCKDIAKRFFHPEEIMDLDLYKDAMLGWRFLHYWTCKEAYVKYLGTGLRTPLNQFCVEEEFGRVKGTQVTLQTEVLDEEYVFAICVAKEKDHHI